jgi:membrane fusion protein (multidrug efflux system)
MTDHNPAMKHKWLIPAAAIMALFLVILYALGLIGAGDKVEPGTQDIAAKPVPPNARTLVVGQRKTDDVQFWPGTIRSRTVARIAPKYTTRIISIEVNAGDSVKKGQVLARLDEREATASLNEAHARLAAARAQAAQAIADEKRIRVLYEKQAATRENYDAVIARSRAAQANVKQAANAVEQLRVSLGENSLRAPFDGIISQRLKEPGDMGLAGEPIVVLQKPEDLRLEVAIPNFCASRVRTGMAVDVRVDALDKVLKAKIDEITPQIDIETRTQLVKAALPKTEGLQPGLLAWLMLNCSDEHQAILIPASAVLHYGQLEAVTIVKDNRVYTRHIRTGKQYGDEVEVLSGLRDGETILISSGSPE